MRLFGEPWTPETADTWTRHDLLAAVLSATVFVAVALGATWTFIGNPRGWAWLGLALGASLLLHAIIERKLQAQSEAFRRHEKAHKQAVDDRNRWEG